MMVWLSALFASLVGILLCLFQGTETSFTMMFGYIYGAVITATIHSYIVRR